MKTLVLFVFAIVAIATSEAFPYYGINKRNFSDERRYWFFLLEIASGGNGANGGRGEDGGAGGGNGGRGGDGSDGGNAGRIKFHGK